MTYEATVLPEPELEFRFGQRAQDPRDGLALFGPYSSSHPSHPASIPWGVVGTDSGVELFGLWAAMMSHAATDAPKDNLRLWPPFPGFEAAFACRWEARPAWSSIIDAAELSKLASRADPSERAFGVVGAYVDPFRVFPKLDRQPAVVICVVPDEVYQNCRPKSRVSQPTGDRITRQMRHARQAGQFELFNSFDPAQYDHSVDFRRQLKARAMAHGVPVQIVRESTLRMDSAQPFGARPLSPLSDRMWNLSNSLFYKAGGKPWKLPSARDGVCYVGISFRRVDPDTSKETAACAAQMFLDDGDGVVFLGEFGPWYSPEDQQYVLKPGAARALLSGILDTYQALHGRTLIEVFVHSPCQIRREEYEAYCKAVPPGCKVVAVRVRTDRDGPRLYRDGAMPVIRGTFLREGDRAGYLFASGFKERLGTYDGAEVPVPLRIDVQHGDADVTDVARDILGLTKLNYNACRLGESRPVTIGFSDAVGEVLVSNRGVKNPQATFKFYI